MDIRAVGDNASEVGHASVSKLLNTFLALLERSEDAGVAGLSDDREQRLGLGAKLRLGRGASDGYGQFHRDAE